MNRSSRIATRIPGPRQKPRLVRLGQRSLVPALAGLLLAVAGGLGPFIAGFPPAPRAVAALAAAQAISADLESFTVMGVDAERAAAVAARATELRQRISSQLLGIDQPEIWKTRCEIHVHLTEESFADAVGGAPASARGATSIEFFGDDVGLRRIDVMGDTPGEAIPDALAHELVHVILADRFSDGPPPRWADEGLAMLFDPEVKQIGHDEDFRDAAIRGLAWSGRDMFEIALDPADIGRERVFYGESLALVRWFLAQGSAETFLSFLEDCDAEGIDESLARHYQIGALAEFDNHWQGVLTASR
jgi:hypothetical protein